MTGHRNAYAVTARPGGDGMAGRRAVYNHIVGQRAAYNDMAGCGAGEDKDGRRATYNGMAGRGGNSILSIAIESST